MAIVKTYFYLLVACILFSLFDPYSFDIQINVGVGPTFNIIDILFILGLMVSIKYGKLKYMKRSIVVLLLIWIAWGWISILRGSMQFGLKAAIFESKFYTVFPMFLLVFYSLFTSSQKLFDKFIKFIWPYGVYIVLALFLISLLSYLLTGESRLISFIEYLDPKRYALMLWDDENSWARFLNAYSALFLAISLPTIVIGKYVYKQNININFVTMVVSFIAIILGQVRTSWAVFAAGILFSLVTFVLHSRNRVFLIKVIIYLFIAVSLTITLTLSLNEKGYIDIERSLTPINEGFSATDTFQWREIVWAIALAKWSTQPIVGLGYGGFYQDIKGEEVWAPHSSYVAVLVKQGIVGLSLMVLFFLNLLIYYLKNFIRGLNNKIKYGGFIGAFTVISTFIFAYSYETTLIQWMFLGISLFYIDIGEKELRTVINE